MSAAYYVPCEIVDRCLHPADMGSLIKLMAAGARREPLAMVRLLGGAWAVRFDFMEPVVALDGTHKALQFVLAVHPEGGLG